MGALGVKPAETYLVTTRDFGTKIAQAQNATTPNF